MTEPNYLLKVTAFVTRPAPAGTELLLFQHPNAGIQIPAGTVEEGEAPEQAAVREVFEETGLSGVRVLQHIGWRDELPPGFTNVILHTTPVYSRPDPSSFDWAKLRRGIAVRLLRQVDGYAQVTYEEGDRYPDPTYISYQITGWVPIQVLASTNRRHFFHLVCEQPAPASWSHFADHHNFQPFWAPLSTPPAIIPPQQAWLDFVRERYNFS